MNDHSYRPAHQRGRLVYLTHPDAAIGRAIYDCFIDRGFLASMLPDVAAIARLVTIRRPDLVMMPLGEVTPEVDETFGVLDAIRGLHLGIVSFLLAPEGARAELVTAAVKSGADEVFSPPYSAPDIVATAERAFADDVTPPAGLDGETSVAFAGFATLTYREQQILQLVVEGRTNKEIAVEFGLSYRTVEVHRRHILGKTGARNTAELVRMALKR